MISNLTNFEIQSALNIVIGAKLVVDGQIGPKTKAEIERYRQMRGIAPENTLASLEKEFRAVTTGKIIVPQTNLLGAEIVKCAKQYVGLKEVISNAEWDDPNTPQKDARAAKFESWIKRAGHQDGWAYCMSAAEGIVTEAIENLNLKSQYDWLLKALNPSVMSSFNNLNKMGKISLSPVPGSICFMQKGNTSNGHAFIVEKLQGSVLTTLEGNTSLGVSVTVEGDRNGDWFTRKTRPLSFSRSQGLWIRGFWNPS